MITAKNPRMMRSADPPLAHTLTRYIFASAYGNEGLEKSYGK
jgi:hypothetical protein